MKRSIAFVDEAAEEKLGKMLRSTRSRCYSEKDCFACLQEMETFKKDYVVFVTVEGKVMDIPLPPSVIFQHGQLVEEDSEIEEEDEGIIAGEAEEWLRKNIREAGIRIRTKIYDKMNGVRLVADIEHDPADYDTWDCCDWDWGNKATFVVSCDKKENTCRSLLNPPSLIVRYDVLAGHLTSTLITGPEWDQHKFLLG